MLCKGNPKIAPGIKPILFDNLLFSAVLKELSKIKFGSRILSHTVKELFRAFSYKKTELFQKSDFKSKPPKKPGNTPLSGFYLSFLAINTTVSSVDNFSKETSPTISIS